MDKMINIHEGTPTSSPEQDAAGGEMRIVTWQVVYLQRALTLLISLIIVSLIILLIIGLVGLKSVLAIPVPPFQFYYVTIILTRMHSSRMHTVCSSSRLGGGVTARGSTCPGGCICPGGCTCWGSTCPGGVPAQGRCTCQEVPAQGGVPARGSTCLGGVPARWGDVPAQGGYLSRGVYLPGGGTCPGTPPLWTDRQV